MKAQKTYICHSDAGHGWLAVKRQELQDLGLLQHITEYSYVKGNTVYLEEDCDASMFVDTLRKNGIEFKCKSGKHYDRSPIRGYNHYSK